MRHLTTTLYHQISKQNQQHELLEKSTKIRIQQLQNNLWSTTNILQYSNPIIDGLNKHTTNFKIIQLLNHLDAQIIHNTNTTWPTTITHNAYPIEPLLHKHELYTTFKKQLYTKQILYLD